MQQNDPWAAFSPEPVPSAQPSPFGNRPIIQEAPPAPKEPTPQTPEQRQATVVGTQQTQTQIKNTQFDNVNNLRKQFETEQPVQDYKTVLPLMDNAFKLGPNKAGDLNLVYAFGKAMDPNSVVREGEQVMATNVGGVSEKVKGYIAQIDGQGQLTPVQRTQLIEEVRNRARSLQQTYNQRRAFYEDFANRNGIRAEDVVGPHPGDPFQADEKAYIQAHGGTPRIDGTPIGGQQGARQLSPEEQQKFFSVLQSQGPDAADAYLRQFGLALKSKEAAAKPHSSQIQYPAVQGLAEGLGGVAEAVGDTLGIISNPVLAGINALAGTNYNPDMGANVRNALGLPEASTPGQQFVNAAGGAALAGGAMGGIARAAAPAFSGVMGNALAQFGASPGADAIMSGTSGGAAEMTRQNGGGMGAQLAAGLAGGIAGAPLASRLSGAVARSSRQAPSLVDPATGTLNEPLEAVGPGGRVQAAKQFGIDLPLGAATDRGGAIMEKALDNFPGSAGVMNDARRTAESQTQNAVEHVAGQFGSARTLHEAGSDVQQGAKDWMTRFDATTSKAYNAIPIADRAPTSLNSTKATLEQLSGKLESNPDLQEEIRDPALLRYLDAINKHGLSWKDLKDFRTFVGNKVGQFRLAEDARTGDYRAIYAALSEDMRNSAAAHPGGLQAFDRANTLYAQGQQRIDQALSRILGPDMMKNPEGAAKTIQAMTQGGKATGDLRTLAAIKASTVKTGAWDEVSATLIRLGGKPADSPGRQFDPVTFVRWYSDMAEPARAMLFKPELRKTLDQFVAVNQRLAGSNALRNTSNSATVISGLGTLTTAMGAVTNPMAGAKLGAVMGGAYATAKLWTSPRFVQWATGYSRAAASGNQNAVRSQVGRLSKLAATNPELRAPIESLLQRIANDNAVPAVAASPDTQSQDQQ